MSSASNSSAVQRPAGRVVRPTRSLLEGGAYTPAASTDLKARFDRLRAEAEDVSAWADGTSVLNLNRQRMRA